MLFKKISSDNLRGYFYEHPTSTCWQTFVSNLSHLNSTSHWPWAILTQLWTTRPSYCEKPNSWIYWGIPHVDSYRNLLQNCRVQDLSTCVNIKKPIPHFLCRPPGQNESRGLVISFSAKKIELKCSFVRCRKHPRWWWNGAAERHNSIALLRGTIAAELNHPVSTRSWTHFPQTVTNHAEKYED